MTWQIVLERNGTRVFRGARTTRPPSGSFERAASFRIACRGSLPARADEPVRRGVHRARVVLSRSDEPVESLIGAVFGAARGGSTPSSIQKGETNERPLIGVVVLVALALASTAIAGSENGNKIQCFDGVTDGGFNGTCALTAEGATLDTVDGDADPNNAYAGVYLQNSNLDGKLVSKSTSSRSRSTDWEPQVDRHDISVPIDEDDDGTTEAYAFVDTLGCNDSSPISGTLDAIDDPTCLVAYGATVYPNWAAFASANPTYRLASDALSFVIVDQPGEFTITNVQLGKGPAKPAK